LIAGLALLAIELATPPSLSALCPRPLPGEIMVCSDAEPHKSPYRVPFSLPPERGSKNGISVSRERNALFDYDSGGAGSCSAAGLAGSYGCGGRAHMNWVEQRAGARSGAGRIYDAEPN
jgi:hypothetical protein